MDASKILTFDHMIVVAATFAVVLLAVTLHYEALTLLSRKLARLARKPRRRILLLIFFNLILHVIQIWLFAVVYWILLLNPTFGHFVGTETITFFDHVYFSAVVFTTLGFGDIIPIGYIRFLVGTEALAGLVLITWSASFTFVEMQRYWK